MSKLTQIEKEYIKANWKDKSIEDIAKKLETTAEGIDEISKYIETLKEKNKNSNEKNIQIRKQKEKNTEPIYKRYTIEPYKIMKIDFVLAAIAFLLTLITYTLTLTPSLSAGDNGELTTAAYFLGVGHAPGYPFYVLMSKIFTYLPFGNIAWRTNFFSAFCAALSVGVVYLILIKFLGQNRKITKFSPVVQLPALFGSLLLTISDNMWAQATMAEVYSLNILQLSTIILLLVYWFEAVWKHADEEVPYYGKKYLMAFGFLYGVAIANHHVTLAFAFGPIFMIAFVLLLVHKRRYIENIETAFISIFVFIVLVCIGGFGYYRFIMNYEAYLYFPPGIASSDSFLSIIFKPFININILSDIIAAFANGSLLRPDQFASLKDPMYPTLYKGIFLVFWPLFLVVVWVVIYKYILCKSSKFNHDSDYITGISIVYYQMLLMLTLGLIIYAYMPIRARALPPLNWGQLNEPSGWENLSYLFSMIHRKQYGASGNDIKALFILHPEQVKALINIFKTQLTSLGILFFIPGLFQIFKKNKAACIFSIFGLITFSVSLMAYTNPPPSVRTLSFVEVFFLPATMYMIFITGFGCQFYMEYFNKNIKNIFKKDTEPVSSQKQITFNTTHIVSVIAILAILTPIFFANLKRNNNYNDFSNHDYPYNLMNSLPNNAIFATEGGDNQVFGLVYYGMVERRRPDLKVYDQKGNVFERVYGNLMKTDGRWIGEISDKVDKDFIESGRPYYMAWKRDGLERLGDYYFKPYGLVFRVLPIRYSLVDELEFYKYLTVNDYKKIAKENLKRDYENDKITKDLHTLLDEGLIKVERKNNYNGNEEIEFLKMPQQPFPELKTEEDYWASYRMHGSVEEQSYWDFLTREIFVSSYGVAKIDLYKRQIKKYENLIASMGTLDKARNSITRKEAEDKIAYYKEEKTKEEDKMLAIGFDMSNVYFIVGNNAILEGNYQRAAEMFENVVKLEKLVYPAYFNLTATYEYIARDPKTPYSEEKKYLEKAKEVLSRAEKTFYRGGRRKADIEKDQNYQQIKQYVTRLDSQMKNTREQADQLKAQAERENTFESYNAYANYAYQSRQDLDQTIWGKENAEKIAGNKDQKMAIKRDLSALYLNMGDTDKASNKLKELQNTAGLTKDERATIDIDIANLYFNVRRYDDAIAIYNKYTNEINQSGAFSLYALGHIAVEMQELEKALQIYNDFNNKMTEVAKTNQTVAAIKKDIDSRIMQITQYLKANGRI